ncbi:hypothetical protein RJT34_12037 [Clitoria ternatea]|uniref:Uncharacterized protein n=1 Tax=Clitoria ternatea TaxID=43366 RepID=A0AAN9PK38_CLITE
MADSERNDTVVFITIARHDCSLTARGRETSWIMTIDAKISAGTLYAKGSNLKVDRILNTSQDPESFLGQRKQENLEHQLVLQALLGKKLSSSHNPPDGEGGFEQTSIVEENSQDSGLAQADTKEEDDVSKVEQKSQDFSNDPSKTTSTDNSFHTN